MSVLSTLNHDAGPSAVRSLKRRLDTQTLGIMEISSNKPGRSHVGFSRQASKDWALRPEVRDLMRGTSRCLRQVKCTAFQCTSKNQTILFCLSIPFPPSTSCLLLKAFPRVFQVRVVLFPTRLSFGHEVQKTWKQCQMLS